MRRNSTVIRAALAAASTLGIAAALAGAMLLLAGTTGGPAWGDGPEDCPPGSAWNPELGACIEIIIPSQSPGVPGSPGDEGGGPAVCRDQDGSEVPCTKDALTWWGAPRYCYAEVMIPQMPPPPGQKAGEGQWWGCPTGTSSGLVWWVEDGEAPVDPVTIATQLQVSLPYELANAKIAPPPTYHTYISYKNWLWISSDQWHAVTASQSVGGATVTLTATPSYTSWDLGNGDTVSCVGSGREWVKGMSEDAPTNCSYAYDSMDDPEGDTWTVSARINYTLAWTCTGNCGGLTSGDLPAALAAAGNSTSITVYQRQTVVE
jgi:hypothetical protein